MLAPESLFSFARDVQPLEGLYFVKVEASTKGSKVVPTKQFTVGSLTEEDLRSLPNQSDEHHHEGHH
jgi:hypothetical protein